MERIIIGRSATLTQMFTVAPTGAPTLVVKRSDGTTVSTGSVSGATTSWSYTIPASSNTLLDTYTQTWTAIQGGEAQTYVDTIEVVGGYLCGLDELRAIFTDTTAYPDAKLRDVHTSAEVSLEKALGWAAVPRYALETRRIRGGKIGTRPRLRTVRSITVNGAAYSAATLAALGIDPSGAIYTGTAGLGSGWGYRRAGGIAVVGYEHGEDGPDADITRAVLLAAQENEGTSGRDPWVRSRTADNMSITYAGQAARDHFADPTLNAIIRANAQPRIA